MYYVYILSNKWHTVFYTGLTNDIRRRTFEHRTKKYRNAFTAKFNCDKLMYYEECDSLEYAIQRERDVKRLDRVYKMQLIMRLNPTLKDLSEGWHFIDSTP